MREFIPGRKLSRLFFEDAVRPIIDRAAPGLKYAAGLIGSGSEVMGFDDEMSTDHHWGPRVMIFLNELDHNRVHDIVDRELRDNLPTTFLGYPTNFSLPDPNDNNVRHLVPLETGPVNHRVDLLIPRDYFLSYLGFDINSDIEPVDWLTWPGQKLRSIAAAAVFHDEIGLNELVTRFAYYPHDVWLYLLAAAWNRVGEEEHLVGRAGFVGDELGASLIGSRLTRDAMNLCFLMERRYAPYPKWFGTAFRELESSNALIPHLERIPTSRNWREREEHLVAVYEFIASMHNRLEITEPLAVKARDFFGRPFKAMELTGGFSAAIRAAIRDDEVKRIAARTLIGSVDQFSDNTDLLSDARYRSTLKRLYE